MSQHLNGLTNWLELNRRISSVRGLFLGRAVAQRDVHPAARQTSRIDGGPLIRFDDEHSRIPNAQVAASKIACHVPRGELRGVCRKRCGGLVQRFTRTVSVRSEHAVRVSPPPPCRTATKTRLHRASWANRTEEFLAGGEAAAE